MDLRPVKSLYLVGEEGPGPHLSDRVTRVDRTDH